MMDILICKIKYPNDPTGNQRAHQNFIGIYTGKTIVLHSISSILGKEYKVYPDGKPNPDYFIFDGTDQALASLKAPSFIDCTKGYLLTITDDMDINKLSNRQIPSDIRLRIETKIRQKQKEGKYTEYTLNSKEFISNNPKVNKKGWGL
ncbi:hypothetical protein [uncultured Ezakiella sp.]|uniref:hypothetical protein n=1 Tax=uncultured Ezakiella sp. TaxID=1637529 RepID=UPI0025E3EAE1|nr:hypothetical protein [uncultured Ezakiella sp.]